MSTTATKPGASETTARSIPSRRGTPAPLARRRTPLRALGIAAVWVWVIFNVLIFAWMLLSSLKSDGEVFADPWGLPDVWRFENYVRAWEGSDLGIATINSVVLVGLTAVFTVAIGAMAAYPLSRLGSRSTSITTMYFVLGMGVPLQSIVVPAYIAMAGLNMTNTLGGLFLLYVGFSLPFTVFLLTGFFRSLPTRLEEAATLDGCSAFRTFRSVMLPLARPGIVTALLLNVVSLWNETLLALIFIIDDDRQTLALAILNFYGTMLYNNAWGALFAGVCIVVLPMLLLYIWLGKNIMDGMTLGATK